MDVATQLLEAMAVPEASQRLVRMSWEEYVALPHELRADWINGEVVVSPLPRVVHAAVTLRIGALLLDALPDLVVVGETGVWLPGNRLRGPDLSVLASLPESRWVEDPPLLVVEVLSPSTRSEDLLRKGPEYAAAGVGHFWVADPDARSIEVSENVDGAWRLLVRLDDEHPIAQAGVGEHGVVTLDLIGILGPPTTGS